MVGTRTKREEEASRGGSVRFSGAGGASEPMRGDGGNDYGSLAIEEEEVLQEDGGDDDNWGKDVDANVVVEAKDRGERFRSRASARGGLVSAAQRRSAFDAWLLRDFSVRRGLGSGRSGGLGASLFQSLLGPPTDHAVEEMAQKEQGENGDDGGRPTLAFKSVDRGIVDTAVWHRRKKDLMGDGSGDEDGYNYDAARVHILESARHSLDRLVVMGIGIAMAVTGVVVSKTADTILEGKIDRALERFQSDGRTSAMAFYVGGSVLLGLMAYLPVARCPVSAGSGIAEAKAILNGVVVPQCTALPTALCKGLSVIMSVAASLPAGLEGPMIHLGLCIGDNANRAVPRNRAAFDMLRSDRSRLDYAAIGTAAGVAAAFRSPISGVLFAMEEGSSFWSTQLTWRCFMSACVCVVVLYLLLGCLKDDYTVRSMALFTPDEDNVAPVPDFAFWEYTLFVAVGAAGGLIGGAFCMANRSLAILRRSLSLGRFAKALEVVCIVAVAAFLTWTLPSLPFLTSCRDLAYTTMPSHHFRKYDCPDGQYNELATLLLNPLGGGGITLLFNEGPDAFSIRACCVAGLLHLVVLCVAFGMSVSAGIFIPLLFVGACLGRALGIAAGLDARTYAIVGAAATLGGVVRVLISLTAIITHTTNLGQFMTPIMIATVMAQFVGNRASGRPGIYDIILQLRAVPFLEEEPPEGVRHANVRARNIMKKNVVTMGTRIHVGELVGILRKYDYTSFPVVDKCGDGSLLGTISRVDLLAILSRPDAFFSDEGEEEDDGDVQREGGLALPYAELDRARPPTDPLPGPEDIGVGLTAEDEAKFVHLAPYAQIAPHTVDGHGSAERAYMLFRSLGLRLLVVVDKNFRPIGIITRHELALLEEIGMGEHMVQSRRLESSIYTSVSHFE